MKVYDIIEPANEAELSDNLRRQPLTDAVLDLVVIAQRLDELARRRGDEWTEEIVQFSIDTIHMTRPTALLGRVAMDGVVLAGRIDSVGGSDNDVENRLELVVVD